MMRAALAYLHENARHPSYDREHWMPVYVVAWGLVRDEFEAMHSRPWGYWRDGQLSPSVSQRESLRRAITTLARDGRVEVCQQWYSADDDVRHWGGLHCRLTESEYASVSVGESPTLTAPNTAAVVGDLAAAAFGGAE